jgi:hypothetical protein
MCALSKRRGVFLLVRCLEHNLPRHHSAGWGPASNEHKCVNESWMPAFAGMTELGDGHMTNNPFSQKPHLQSKQTLAI